MEKQPTLAEPAHALAAILGAIMMMSDEVKNAASPLEAQHRLLKLQGSLQRNGTRVGPYVRVILDAAMAERAEAA